MIDQRLQLGIHGARIGFGLLAAGGQIPGQQTEQEAQEQPAEEQDIGVAEQRQTGFRLKLQYPLALAKFDFGFLNRLRLSIVGRKQIEEQRQPLAFFLAVKRLVVENAQIDRCVSHEIERCHQIVDAIGRINGADYFPASVADRVRGATWPVHRHEHKQGGLRLRVLVVAQGDASGDGQVVGVACLFDGTSTFGFGKKIKPDRLCGTLRSRRRVQNDEGRVVLRRRPDRKIGQAMPASDRRDKGGMIVAGNTGGKTVGRNARNMRLQLKPPRIGLPVSRRQMRGHREKSAQSAQELRMRAQAVAQFSANQGDFTRLHRLQIRLLLFRYEKRQPTGQSDAKQRHHQRQGPRNKQNAAQGRE